MTRAPAGLLLDTHVLIWWLEDRELAPGVRDRIADPVVVVRASIVNHWEIAVKEAIGKMRAPDGYVDALEADGITTLPVTLGHIDIVRTLPLVHRDPFDRMLVAQARAEGLTLVTRDHRLRGYDVGLLDA